MSGLSKVSVEQAAVSHADMHLWAGCQEGAEEWGGRQDGNQPASS